MHSKRADQCVTGRNVDVLCYHRGLLEQAGAESVVAVVPVQAWTVRANSVDKPPVQAAISYSESLEPKRSDDP